MEQMKFIRVAGWVVPIDPTKYIDGLWISILPQTAPVDGCG